MNRKATRKAAPLFTLTDTGPLVALIDEDDPYFQQAGEALKRLPKVPLLTTWACFTEAMYLLHQAGGYDAQEKLWGLVADGLIRLHIPSETEWQRMRALMTTYRDTPMDLADASVVAAAEVLSVWRVFTFDSHFYVYRMTDGDTFELLQ